ncbi:related to NADH2 dehydrogenase (ubiquinone) 9.5K protein, ubiquinone-binding [Rhynchosporium agropyri]|uniref:Related to NADH2 dehydrogenase (Ubiquinone) 9.5K protein, ubiquinone-binding n=1 Tax=Rhynchosporium agropyri TaxID=914238 RepID=A0A1E1LJ39_9HELO|nr:related to NADH2 dehydrogenase (ubiquinone) 9.5K protein, ubiquinone-binding [Rhynchosporium agropyri]
MPDEQLIRGKARDSNGPSSWPSSWNVIDSKSTITCNSPATPETYRRVVAYHQLNTMSAVPRFFSQPIRYMRWAAIEKPAIFFSIVIGSLGPVTVFTVPPIRRMLGDEQRPEIPLTYPIPTGPRRTLEGFEDE